MAILLQETQRAVFYAPFYAAMALGAFGAEGVEVTFRSSSTPDDAAADVAAGVTDVSWGGPMRVIRSRAQNSKSDLICFCEVVTRDPFLLVGRAPKPDFELSHLFGLRLGTVSEVPTPWCCLQEDIRRAGLDPSKLDRSTGRSMAEHVEGLRRGELDVIQLLEPYVQDLIADDAGHIWYEAAGRGPTSYTCFYTRRAVLEQRRSELRAMTRAIYRTQKWVHESHPKRIAGTIASYFPAIASDRLTAAVANYQRLGVWGRDPRLPKSGYERLAAGLISSGMVANAAAFEDAVDNSMAEEAMSSDPPPLEANRTDRVAPQA